MQRYDHLSRWRRQGTVKGTNVNSNEWNKQSMQTSDTYQGQWLAHTFQHPLLRVHPDTQPQESWIQNLSHGNWISTERNKTWGQWEMIWTQSNGNLVIGVHIRACCRLQMVNTEIFRYCVTCIRSGGGMIRWPSWRDSLSWSYWEWPTTLAPYADVPRVVTQCF